MNVLLLDFDESPHAGRLKMARLARFWMNGGLARPLLACPADSELAAKAAELDVPLLPLRGRSPFNPLLLYALIRASRNCEVILTQGKAVSLGAWLASRRKGLGHVIAHWSDVFEGTRGQKRCYARAGAVVCPTQELAAQLAAQLATQQLAQQAESAPALRTRTVELALDMATCTPRMERHDGRFVFIALGDLVEERGHEVLIDAMGLLQDMEGLPQWEARIVGSGPCFEALLNKARSLEVDRCLALLGPQDRHAMLPQADALVAPDIKSEAAALTIKEAWATGLPVIASSVGAHTELLRNKDNALLTPAGNAVTLAAAMMRCMQDADLRAMLVQHGTASLAHYTPERLASQMAEICEEARLFAITSALPPASKAPAPAVVPAPEFAELSPSSSSTSDER